jgi:dUTP pyrophosphatase
MRRKIRETRDSFYDVNLLFVIVFMTITYINENIYIKALTTLVSCLYIFLTIYVYRQEKKDKVVLLDEEYIFQELDSLRNNMLQMKMSKSGKCNCNNNSCKTKSIIIKYSDKDMPKLGNIDGDKSDWVDLYANEQIELKAGEFKLIDLGVAMELPEGYEAQVIPRSSTFKKYGILQANSIGLIDNSYCGDGDIWRFPAYTTKDVIVPKFERICQFRINKKMEKILFAEVDNLDKNSDRGGFGSTDIK